MPGTWPLPVSLPVGSPGLQVCKEAACTICGWCGNKQGPHSRKQSKYWGVGVYARCLGPLSLPEACRTLGGSQGRSPSCPLPRKRRSFVNTEANNNHHPPKPSEAHLPSLPPKNQQGFHTGWGKLVLVLGGNGKVRTWEGECMVGEVGQPGIGHWPLGHLWAVGDGGFFF